jgi:hypothetical protein
MHLGRVTVTAVVVAVVTTAVVFGPLVPGFALAAEPEPVISNSGSLTATDVTLPSSATIESAAYGAANHYVSVPPATVEFDSIRGTSTLIYALSLETGYKTSTTHFIDESYGPVYEAKLGTGAITLPSEPPDQYAGELSVAVRNESGKRVLERRNVTVRVRA